MRLILEISLFFLALGGSAASGGKSGLRKRNKLPKLNVMNRQSKLKKVSRQSRWRRANRQSERRRMNR
jgi:hypothetical protein